MGLMSARVVEGTVLRFHFPFKTKIFTSTMATAASREVRSENDDATDPYLSPGLAYKELSFSDLPCALALSLTLFTLPDFD